MSKPAGRCAFCNATGLSKEHIFPDWLRTKYPRNPLSTHTLGRVTWPNGQKNIRTKKGQGHSGAKKVRVVCTACNNGWMSALESSAKPLLMALIEGRSQTLSVADQEVLALWALKTVCMGEFLNPGQGVLRQKDRESIYLNQALPPHWHVFLTPYRGEDYRDLFLYQHVANFAVPRKDSPGEESYYIEQSVLGMGQVLVSVIGTSWPQVGAQLQQLSQPGFQIVWPATVDLEWSAALCLNDSTASRIVHRLEELLGTLTVNG